MCRTKGQSFGPFWSENGNRFCPFWSENGYRFCPFWSENGYGLRRNYGCVSMCSSFQFQMNVEESVICEFEMDFKKSFCFRFNLSNDDYIISSITGKYCSVAFV